MVALTEHARHRHRRKTALDPSLADLSHRGTHTNQTLTDPPALHVTLTNLGAARPAAACTDPQPLSMPMPVVIDFTLTRRCKDLALDLALTRNLITARRCRRTA